MNLQVYCRRLVCRNRRRWFDEHLTLSRLASLLAHVSGEDQHELVESPLQNRLWIELTMIKDGKLSLMEFVEHIGKHKEIQAAFQGWEIGYKDADADKDGHLKVHEMAEPFTHFSREAQHEMIKESSASLFASVLEGFDTDKNGKISLQEMMELVHESGESLAASIMDGFDTDKDRKLSLKEPKDGDKAEGQAAFAGWEVGFKEEDEDDMLSLISHVQRDHRHKLVEEADATAASVMEGFDIDKDGKISKKELQDKIGAKRGSFKGWQTGIKEADADKEHKDGDKAEGQAAFAGWEDGFKEADEDEMLSFIRHVTQAVLARIAEKWLATAMQAGFEPYISSSTAVISANAKAGKHTTAEEWLAIAMQAGLEPKINCYTTVMPACANECSYTMAEKWLAKDAKEGLEPDIIS